MREHTIRTQYWAPQMNCCGVTRNSTRDKSRPCYVKQMYYISIKDGARFCADFEDVFVHARANKGNTEVLVRWLLIRKVRTLMCDNKLYSWRRVYHSKQDTTYHSHRCKIRHTPRSETNKSITDWSVPAHVGGIRKWLGLVTYLHKYARNYAEVTVHLSHLLKWTRNVHGMPIVSIHINAPSRS